jgi:chemotaxis protein CheD
MSEPVAQPRPGAPELSSPEAEGRPQVYLHPGQVFASSEPLAVTTILATCVAVCLWDPLRRVGGINHYLLPRGGGREERSARYGEVAMKMLLARLGQLGASPARLQAKVFGGMTSAFGARDAGRDLGANNVEFALATLATEGIPVVASDVGGTRPRKLIYHVDEGIVWVRPL